MKANQHNMNDDKPVPQISSPEFTHANQSKSKKFKPFGKGFKSPGVIVFVILFAAIGTYLIFNSFAATTTATLEAETLTGSGEIINAQYASGGKALAIRNTTVPAAGTFTTNESTTDISIKARGGQCRGAPQASITIDNKQVLTANVSDDNWVTYTATLTTPIAAGNHTIKAALTNPLRKGNCSRILYLDIITTSNNAPTPPPTDTAVPEISITAPTNGTTVSGTVSVTATASDNVGVTKVEFSVDNKAPTTVTASPYNYSWNTLSEINGSHAVKATAYDAAGNTKSSTVTVTVNNVIVTPPPTSSDTVRNISGYTGADYTDTKGNKWVKDANFTSGKSYTSPNTIAGTSDPTLYKQSRSGSSGNTFDYNIPLNNGTYTLKLHFAEIWTPNCVNNRRTFNVSANGNAILTNFDIFAAGGCETAHVVTKTVSVNDGTLNLHFTAGTTGAADPNPMVNAIEVSPAVTGPDTEKPSVPSSLTASAFSGTQVELRWNASTDNVGVDKYFIYRDGGTTPIGSTARTDYLDSGLAQYSDHTYTVTACDIMSNCSNQSAPVSVKTKDTAPPTQPSNVSATGTSSSAVRVAWNASTDAGTGLAGYSVYRNGSKVANNITGTNFTDSGLSPNTAYSYTVEACDNASPANCISSGPVSGTTQAAVDTTPPSAPGNFRATVNSSTQITLNWNASTDSESPSGITYTVTRNGTPVASNVASLSYVDSGLTASTTYQYAITARNSANLVSAASTVSSTTQAAPDTTAPSVPTNLNGTAASTSQINLTWSASTDTGGSGLAGYNVYRNGAKINSSLVTSTSYGDTGLTANTAYSYTVNAVDGASNSSAQSAAKSVTTQNTTPPPTGGGCTNFANPGSLSSVSSALNSTPSGGVLCLRGGTYTGSRVTLSGSKTVKSAPGETAVIDAAGQSLGSRDDVLTLGSGLTFSDIEIKNSSGRALSITGSNTRVVNNRIHDIQYNGILDAGTNNIIEGNKVWRTVLSNTNAILGGSGWAEAINTWNANNSTIRNNEIYDSWGEGIDYINSNGGLAEGNLVYRNYSVQIYLDGSSNVTVRNNKLGANIAGANRAVTGVLVASEGGGSVSGNLVTGNYFTVTPYYSTWNVPAGAVTFSNNFKCDTSYSNCTAL